jgi:hypothetical protein
LSSAARACASGELSGRAVEGAVEIIVWSVSIGG